MATFLYRLGRWAFRRRRAVGLLWVAALAAVLLGAVNAAEAPEDSAEMPGIESQKAFDLINERFPDSEAEGAAARVVFVAEDGRKVTAAENRAAVERFVADAADVPQVASVTDPFAERGVSEDGSTAYAIVTYEVKDDDVGDPGRAGLEAAVDGARAGWPSGRPVPPWCSPG
ncbi:MMPL family transporter [Streptomyces phytohabitans]|uniref:MMPL family transporter n=1 Tax=Streptomyces phytohabitans TaxID=1150371 RepID=UPI00387EBE2C